METPRLRCKAAIVVVTLVAGSGALAYARYRPTLERAHERISTGGRIAASRCGPIEYAEAGEGRPCSSSMAPGAASIRDSSWARGWRVPAFA